MDIMMKRRIRIMTTRAMKVLPLIRPRLLNTYPSGGQF
jgi:hypothetical protein